MTLMGSWAVWTTNQDKKVAIIDLYPRTGDTRCEIGLLAAGRLCHPRSFSGYEIISWADFKKQYGITMDDLLKGAYH